MLTQAQMAPSPAPARAVTWHNGFKAHCDFPALKGEDWQDLLYAELDHLRVRWLICCTFSHVGHSTDRSI